MTPKFTREEPVPEQATPTGISVDDFSVAQEEPSVEPVQQENPDDAQGTVLEESKTTELQKELEGVAKLKRASRKKHVKKRAVQRMVDSPSIHMGVTLDHVEKRMLHWMTSDPKHRAEAPDLVSARGPSPPRTASSTPV